MLESTDDPAEPVSRESGPPIGAPHQGSGRPRIVVAALLSAFFGLLGACGRMAGDAPLTLETPTSASFACASTSWDQPGRTTYYVAIDEPGADNETCDGLSPVDKGNGHCPFRDFSSARVRETLYRGSDGIVGTRRVTLVVREGTYPIVPLNAIEGEPNIPLWIYGSGASEAEAVVLAAYPGETPVLDGTCDPSLPECASPEDPGRLWTILQAWGHWIRVEGITFDNAHKWNITVQASQACFRDNRLLGPYGSDSDSVKSFNGSGPAVVVRQNEFTGHGEQAMDLTNAWDWVIEGNEIHDGVAGIGGKFGMHEVAIRGNYFHHLARTAMGTGTSSDHRYPYEAWDIRFEDNRVEDVGGHAFQIVFCARCSIRNNSVTRAVYGISMPNQGPSGCPGGCRPSTAIEIVNNRFREMLGATKGGVPPDLFVAVDPTVVADIIAADNLYCVGSGSRAAFWRGGEEILDFAAWIAAVETDSSSSVLPLADPECSSW